LIQRQRADLKAGEEYCKNRIKFSNIFEKFENFQQFFKKREGRISHPSLGGTKCIKSRQTDFLLYIYIGDRR
jgi:hypothetical protein